jgi:hypothetical protein
MADAPGAVVTRSRFNDPIEPMTLQNMRENGVRSLAIQCHQKLLLMNEWPIIRGGWRF